MLYRSHCCFLLVLLHLLFFFLGTEERENITFRMACFTFRILAFFIIPAFSADLTAYLAIRTINIPFLTAEDFIKNGKFKIFLRSGFIKNYLLVKTWWYYLFSPMKVVDFNTFWYFKLFQTSDDLTHRKLISDFTFNDTDEFDRFCEKSGMAFLHTGLEHQGKLLDCRYFRIPRPVFYFFQTLYFSWVGLTYNSIYSWILNYQ